ncbi:MAG: hypothetical protein H0U53_01875, partial [Actinobacteria bacterium]|nr:hypothetical protein [Actinomycetota bacterium]
MPRAKANALEDKIARALKTQDPEKLRDFLRTRAELVAIKEKMGPQTKEEFWEWMKSRVGVELSRVAVCPGHSCQLDMAYELYTFQVLRALWVMSRGGSKCVAEGSMVYDAYDGRRKPVEDLCSGEPIRVASMDSSGAIVTADAYGEVQGIKQCLKITTDSGRVVTLSYDHPLLTSVGWIEAEELEVGERIGLPSLLPEPDWIVPFGEVEIDLLAVLLAEGGLTTSAVMFSTGDPEILRIVQEAASFYDCRV